MGPSINPASTSAPGDNPQQTKDPFMGETLVRIRKLVRNLPTKTVIRRVHAVFSPL
jgi:hypothetical protein